MPKSNWLTALSLITLAACTGNVNLGGPRDDSGAPDDASAQDGATQSADGGSDSAAPDANDPSTGLDQAAAYADGTVACTTAADCCVVFDGCVNRGYVVGVADKDKVASLLADYDQYEMTIGTASRCTACVPPPVQVSCVQNKCIGTQLPRETSDGGDIDQSFWTNHCGTIGAPESSSHTGSILGC